MTWSEKIRLNKQMLRAVTDAGYLNPKEIQVKTLPRIIGGQDVIAISPQGSGKTITYTLAVLNRINYAPDGVPKILILVPDREKVEEVIAGFELLNKNESLTIVGLYPITGTEAQMNALADGSDIVVATPDRARAIYLKLGLNLNKIELLIIDDAELIVKQGLQLPVAELANSITKCQHLVFSTVMHDKLDKMIAPFMKQPALIEVDEITEEKLQTIEQILYQVPNFATKLNLLHFFLQDSEVFTKVLVFVNSRRTAEKVYESVHTKDKNDVAILNSPSIELLNFNSVDEFIDQNETRILIANNQTLQLTALNQIPFIIQLELPESKEIFLNRVVKQDSLLNSDTLVITFATDLELPFVKEFETTVGKKIPVGELPEGLVVEKDRKKADADEKVDAKPKVKVATAGEAFHQKKPENAKTYNYSSGVKAKMNKKKKYG